ncbi:hypothetical protein VTL71DRAFT_14820 [Oculimacula yallundae]|uniref:Fumarylacetoacetase n=1 Tax=Oculimacula yallundae TaxID=86028 RepID=A0ABR4CJK1_9HELO
MQDQWRQDQISKYLSWSSSTMISSWLDVDSESPFSLANIPFGIISTSANPKPRVAIAIGEYALDVEALAAADVFKNVSSIAKHTSVFSQSTLNAFASLGQSVHVEVRKHIQAILSKDGSHKTLLEQNETLQKQALISLKDVKYHLPMQIGDYTDFYVGKNHAYNIGVLFRGPDNALQPNYMHLPVGYHGRSSSVVVSGTPIKRPSGQILLPGSKTPIYSPCRKLDIELEMGAFVCKENAMGTAVPINEAKEYIFGVVLMNDWSARDIQAWEYVPLGPFLSKNFGTTISPWVVLTSALEPFLEVGLAPGNREELLPYLREDKAANVYNIELSVEIKSKSGHTTVVSKSNAKNLLFSYPQLIAHHSVGGCPMRVGDLMGTGTISGESRDSLGSFLEQSYNGKEAIRLNGGEERMFLEDGDEITLRGICVGEKGCHVGFGDCTGKIV